MDRLNEFRKYYNHTIYPALRRLERRRLKLIMLFIASTVLVLTTLLLEILINNLLITLLLAVPLFLYGSYIYFRIKKFIRSYKPRIMNLILDFMQEPIYYSDLHYEAAKSIPKDVFFSSRLFDTKAPVYRGEDYIKGKIGELEFELSELFVEEEKPLATGMRRVFKGVFVHGRLNFDLDGAVLVWPRNFKQLNVKAIKAATLHGAFNQDYEILTESFKEAFTTYATENTHVAELLPENLQRAMVHYLATLKKKDELYQFHTKPPKPSQPRAIFLSILSNHIFLAISEERDLLEPYILRSNLSFDLIRDYYEQIDLVFQIIEDMDRTY